MYLNYNHLIKFCFPLQTLEKEKVAENEHLQKENDLLQERISRLKAALLTSDFSESSARPDVRCQFVVSTDIFLIPL